MCNSFSPLVTQGKRKEELVKKQVALDMGKDDIWRTEEEYVR